MSLWSLIRIFSENTAIKASLVFLGLYSRRLGLVRGAHIKWLAFLLVHLVLPLCNVQYFLQADLLEFAQYLPLILPVWLFKILLSYLLALLVFKLVEVPAYFERTFICMLMIDSIQDHLSFLKNNLCGQVDSKGEGEKLFDIRIPCDAVGDRLSFYIGFFNSLISLGLAPYFLKSDLLFLKTFGKSMVWIDQELYLTKFEADIEKDKEKYEELVGKVLSKVKKIARRTDTFCWST
jgi:hypothetical protein